MDQSYSQNFFKRLYVYTPLLVITVFSFILSLGFMQEPHDVIYRFMGFFLCTFSLFKWIDIRGFIQSFQEYDIISKLFRPYLYLFPALEFFLGFNYLMMDFLTISNILLIVMMAVNGISISHALIKKKKINCACLGSFVQLPLSIVSLFETILMLIMAAIML